MTDGLADARFAAMRHQGRTSNGGGGGHTFFPTVEVSRYGDALGVLRNPSLFSSFIMASADPVLLGADPPAHTRPSRLLGKAFSTERVEALAEHIQAISDQLVADLERRGEGDLVADLTSQLPIAVIALLLGIDPSRQGDLKRWSDAVVSQGTGIRSENDNGTVERDVGELERFLWDLIEERQRAPEDDIVSLLLKDSDGLSPNEVTSVAKLLLVAGNETTTHLIGNAALSLLNVVSPTVLDDRSLDNMVEETLWLRAPVRLVYRVVTGATAASGVPVKSGDIVAVHLAEANRQTHGSESKANNLPGHLAFGAGPHRCPGARLAILETKTALRSLVSLLPRLRPAETLTATPMVESTQLVGPASLPVRIARR